ncbi:MAG TPA: hypothetical protein VHE30_18885, partial [Polyangiaceae bacterium]|nr:hypothetical protein [Polyangiaceae bacterium]
MTSRTRFVSALCVSLCASGALVAPDALAHGGFPRAFQILVEPGNADDIILRSDLWGFFRTRDGGQTWQWTCAEVYGADSLSVNHNPMALAPGGRLFVTNSFKGLFHTDDGCDWTPSTDFADKLVTDVELDHTNVYVVTSTNTNTEAGVEGLVWKSTENGDHFQKLGVPFPTNLAATQLGIAPSDDKRLYVTGRELEATPGTLLRSDDGGASWKTTPIPTTDSLMTLRIAGIHATRPDVLVIWADLLEGLGQDSFDEIWITADGGGTFKKIYSGAGDLPGFAFSPDGTEIMVAGPKEGLMLAKLDDALANGQSAFTQMIATPLRPTPKDRQVWGLHWDQSGLLGGVDNFTARGVPAFTFGAWMDSDKDFSQIMNVCQAAYDACQKGSDVRTACNKAYDDPAGGFLQDYLESSRCVGNAGKDAGTGGGAAPAPKDSGGCALPGARAEESSTSSAWVAGAFLAALGFARRRRNR